MDVGELRHKLDRKQMTRFDRAQAAYHKELKSRDSYQPRLDHLRGAADAAAGLLLRGIWNNDHSDTEGAAWSAAYYHAAPGSLNAERLRADAEANYLMLYRLRRLLSKPNIPVLRLTLDDPRTKNDAAVDADMTYAFSMSDGTGLKLLRSNHDDAVPKYHALMYPTPPVIDCPVEQFVSGVHSRPSRLANLVAARSTDEHVADPTKHFVVGRAAVRQFFESSKGGRHLDAILGYAVYQGFEPYLLSEDVRRV